MIAVIRLKSKIGASKKVKDTLDMLGLKYVNNMAILEDKKEIKGMLKKVENFVAWGEISAELKDKIKDKKIRLHPPRKGLKSIKLQYPKGDMGYRGKKINDLIKRMLVEK